MDYLYNLIAVNNHIIPDLCSHALYLKDHPNKDQLKLILELLGPIMVQLKPLVESEWPEHNDTIEWIDIQYKAWTLRESWE